MSEPVRYERQGDIAVITIDSPPVNAIDRHIRKGLKEAAAQAASDDSKAVVVHCAGRTFAAGADINEFDTGIAPPPYHEVMNAIEDLAKPVVATLHGTALGGGFELAMACHYRVATPTARVGLPELSLGIIPGAGGTQRAPRLMGAEKALDLMFSMRPMAAKDALEAGVIDQIGGEDPLQNGLDYACLLIDEAKGPRPTRDARANAPEPGFFDAARKEAEKRFPHQPAAVQLVEVIEAAFTQPFDQALALEKERTEALDDTIPSKALRHVFFAERQTRDIPDLPADAKARAVKKVGIIGAGTMGGGIATAFANAGFPVRLIDATQEGLDRGIATIRKNYDSRVKRGRMTEAEVEERMALITPDLEMKNLADVDLVVEAVFESMTLKKDIFGKLAEICQPGTVLGTNTSTLDIEEIARATGRPGDVIGLHFFSPAQVMPLLEVVRTSVTAPDTIATAMEISKPIKKTPVLAGNAFGFIGNRIMDPYGREAEHMLLEGATPDQIDGALQKWGMAMGILAVFDMAGVDVGTKIRAERTDLPDDPTFYRSSQLIVDQGWLGQKTGKGFYVYEGRERKPHPEALDLFRAEAEKLGVQRREISEQEILDRCLCGLVNEAAYVLQEGIALRASDIDVTWTYGYGFPRFRGGPLFFADSEGLSGIVAKIRSFAERFNPEYWQPAPLLVELAEKGSSFQDYDKGR